MRVVISLELQLFESSWDLVQQFNAVNHRKAAGETIVLIVLVTDGSLTKHKNFIHNQHQIIMVICHITIVVVNYIFQFAYVGIIQILQLSFPFSRIHFYAVI